MQFLSMRIASLSPVLYGFGMDSDAFCDHTQVWSFSKLIAKLIIPPLVKEFAISLLPIFLFQKIEGTLHHEALLMPASVLNRAPNQAIMDTNTSTSSASYEVHGDGGISFHQVRLVFPSIYTS